MAIEARYKMSQERLEDLKKELNYLETVREREVSEQIKEARSFGDLSENSEYDEAKTEQGKLYSRIAEVQDLIEHAEIVETKESTNAVSLGSRVKVRVHGRRRARRVHHRRLAGGEPSRGPHFGRLALRPRA